MKVAHRVSQTPEVNAGTPVSLIDVFKGIESFLLAVIAMLVFISFVPELVLLGGCPYVVRQAAAGVLVS